ncbi:hypothetical protein QR680_009890 [Steinernema hermaphroditum]|uniref:Uncharacterized protein n=1 Tax=Steinernema hermaphroditum TaxID=289476 RepID=A0AA39MAJ4_9BILA|nr:hypothetical protein QR680_009890 [Steinernema hermaphroditum]
MTARTPSQLLRQPPSLFEIAVLKFELSGYTVRNIGIREITRRADRVASYLKFLDTYGIFVDIPFRYAVFKDRSVDIVESILNAGERALPKKGNILNHRIGSQDDAYHVMHCFVAAATVLDDPRSTPLVQRKAGNVFQWCVKRVKTAMLLSHKRKPALLSSEA